MIAEPRFCETCRMQLTMRMSRAGVEYLHNGSPWVPFDHPPVPRLASELDWVDIRCNFCLAPDPVLTFGIEDIRFRVTGDRETTIGNMLPEVHACAYCATFLDERDAEGLAQRLLSLLSAHENVDPGPAAKASVYSIAEAVIFNIRYRVPFEAPLTKGQSS